jgi:hypothetical protein
MIMGQIRLIHEHYDSKPWASIISATLIALLALLKLANDIHDHSWIRVVLFCLIMLPSILLLVMDFIWKKKPTLIVYNDRLEVKKSPNSRKMTEIMYSDIKNMFHEAGGLKIWLDVDSRPSNYYLGAKLAQDQETYDILRTAYDQYNQEHGIKPVPVGSMPQKTKTLGQIVLMLTMIGILILLFVLYHNFH